MNSHSNNSRALRFHNDQKLQRQEGQSISKMTKGNFSFLVIYGSDLAIQSEMVANCHNEYTAS